ncbi:IS3 family transposase [Palleronia caenipelagi]|uniref:IS3 family transposase n=1 Tax=Palleronia caenipelagi TaxID=2489174 RepID=A0A547PMR4_9RHOB|nr:IS3 family transposase [Palleronia caenipelagi]
MTVAPVAPRKRENAVSTLCRLVRLSRSWFYGHGAGEAARERREARRAARDEALLERIRHFFKASKGRYGSKRIHRDLCADGKSVSERRVARIMQENRISARPRKRRKPVTTNSNHQLTLSPNLLQRAFHCTTPNTVWLADITYVGTGEGWLYLAAVKECAFVRRRPSGSDRWRRDGQLQGQWRMRPAKSWGGPWPNI